MRKFMDKVVIPVIFLFCLVISGLTGERIMKNFLSFRNYAEIKEEKWNNSYLSVDFEKIQKITAEEGDYYIGHLSDGKYVLVLKDALFLPEIQGSRQLKCVFIDNKMAVDHVRSKITDMNGLESDIDKLSQYILVVKHNPYNLTISTYIQFVVGVIVMIIIMAFKIKSVYKLR